MYFVGDKVALDDITINSLDNQCWSSANEECETYSVNSFGEEREFPGPENSKIEQKGDLSYPVS